MGNSAKLTKSQQIKLILQRVLEIKNGALARLATTRSHEVFNMIKEDKLGELTGMKTCCFFVFGSEHQTCKVIDEAWGAIWSVQFNG